MRVSAIVDSVVEDKAVVLLLAKLLLETGGVKVEVSTELEVRSGGGEDELDDSCADGDVGDGLSEGVGVIVGVGVGVGVGLGVELGVDDCWSLDGGGGEELGAT